MIRVIRNNVAIIEVSNGGIKKFRKVMIGDVLDYLEEGQKGEWMFEDYSQFPQIIEQILLLWKYKRLPIEEQNKECIEYIYNLIK